MVSAVRSIDGFRGGKIGVIQGRLSPRPADRLQAFPKETWRSEFIIARELGLDSIEWIYEHEGASVNPLASESGRESIRQVADSSGVGVLSVCADYFMVHRLAGHSTSELAEHLGEFRQLVAWTADIGARRILLPVLEEARVDTAELQSELVAQLRACTQDLEEHDVTVGLEMDVPGPEYRSVIERVDHPLVGAYYDTGNSAAIGVDIAEDVRHLLPYLQAVHLKDRNVGGGSRPLGSGAANFREFFATLQRGRFSGDFVLQHYFGASEKSDAIRSLRFVCEHLVRARQRFTPSRWPGVAVSSEVG